MLGVMPMQWYVNLVTIAAAGVLGWIALEFLAKPIRVFFALRDRVRAQLLLLANVAPPKPRETISSSLEIQQYDVAVKTGREAQRILRDLGSQMLAFSESEIAACNAIATFGFDAVAAGRGLIALSNTCYRNRTDRADFSSKIEEALRFKARDGSARREWSSRSLRGWARAQRAAFRRAQAQALSACEVERRRFSWAHIRRPSVFEKARQPEACSLSKPESYGHTPRVATHGSQ
jgi:hypothetical protein